MCSDWWLWRNNFELMKHKWLVRNSLTVFHERSTLLLWLHYLMEEGSKGQRYCVCFVIWTKRKLSKKKKKNKDREVVKTNREWAYSSKQFRSDLMAPTLSSLSTASSDKDRAVLHVQPESASSCLSLTVGAFLSLNAAAIVAVEISNNTLLNIIMKC